METVVVSCAGLRRGFADRGRLGVLGALVFACAISVAGAASADGLPLGWSFDQTDNEVRFTVTTEYLLEDLEAEVRRSGSSRRWRFSESRLRPGEAFEFSIPTPDSHGEYTLTISGEYEGEDGEVSADFELGPVDVVEFEMQSYALEGANPSFVITMTQPADRVELRVIGDNGEVILERATPFSGADAGSPLRVGWSQPPGIGLLAFDVRAYSTSGSYNSRQYVPWHLDGEVRDLNFEFGSAEIQESDRARLREAARQLTEVASRVDEWIDVKLYVAGYTDTVGAASSNRRLSQQRARSIGEFMRGEGFRWPIFYQGFGEAVLAEETADGVENAENRRAIYTIRHAAPDGDPSMPGSNWHALR